MDLEQDSKADLIGGPLAYQRRPGGVLETVPADRQQRRRGSHWPVDGLTMIGQVRLESLQRCVEDGAAGGTYPATWIETGVWRGGASVS